MEDSYLCGYLKIKGLTEVSVSIYQATIKDLNLYQAFAYCVLVLVMFNF